MITTSIYENVPYTYLSTQKFHC